MSDTDENLPPGNWMARQLRLINDDSKNFFPATPMSQKRGKFRSLYKHDYVDFPDGFFIEHQADLDKRKRKKHKDSDDETSDEDEEDDKVEEEKKEELKLPPALVWKEELKAIQSKRETLQDVLFGAPVPPAAHMFSNWKIPTSVMDDSHPGDPSGVVATDFENRRMTPQVAPQTPKMHRQATLPVISTSKEAMPMLRRSYTRIPDRARSITPRTPQKLRTPTPPTQHAADMTLLKVTDKDLADKLQPGVVGRAEDWLRKAPHVDRKVIERLLRMSDKKQNLNKAMRRTLLPDARDSVERWLTHCTENERQVALQFFSSLGGSKLVGSNGHEQKQRLNDIISTLKTGKGSRGQVGGSLPLYERDSDSRLQFIRLLDPETRKNRWMHTTWHHLPEYKDNNRVENWSSHYTRPHAPVPRHFVIHPDWG